MEDLELDIITWFSERQVSFKPKHFVIAKTAGATDHSINLGFGGSARFSFGPPFWSSWKLGTVFLHTAL